jgi:hypothetical protein
MKAIKPITQGEEIFNDYGELPRADLLRRYGYVTDNYKVFDVIELSLKDICQAAGLENADVESQPKVHLSIFIPTTFRSSTLTTTLAPIARKPRHPRRRLRDPETSSRKLRSRHILN